MARRLVLKRSLAERTSAARKDYIFQVLNPLIHDGHAEHLYLAVKFASHVPSNNSSRRFLAPKIHF